jgi:ornithine cyclodeaminase/alanine dehydrogenase
MNPSGTLLLKRSEIASLLTLQEYIDIVERAFRLHAEGKTLAPGLLHINAHEGEFHIKAGGLTLTRTYVAVKTNGGFFQNRTRYGMPNIQGTIVLCDGETGYPLAFMDSIAITISRTGATTAVAAKYLARSDSRSVTICGCGNQGRIQLRSLRQILPIETVYAFDSDPAIAREFARVMAEQLNLSVTAVADPGDAVLRSDVCVTCTPSRKPFLKKEHIPPGLFLAAVGADSPDKQELDPRILAGSTLVVDLLEQCARVGELHHALEAGVVRLENVHAELAQVVGGQRPGRTSAREVTVFDATGTALQDAAAAAGLYEKALAGGHGTMVDLLAG